MVSHKIDLEVMLIPNDSKLKKSLQNLSGSFVGGSGGTGGGSKGGSNTFGKLFEKITMGVGILTGILGVLKKVPSVLQASLKIMGIGFLLILKPLADLIGIALMPIGIAMVKLAGFLMKHSGGAGIGGFVGLILGGILAVIVAASLSAPLIATGLIILFGVIAGAILGSIVGGGIEWAWNGLVDFEKDMWKSILNALENWLGIDENTKFIGTVIGYIKAWINDDSDKQSFFNMLVNEFTGINIGGIIKNALETAIRAHPLMMAYEGVTGGTHGKGNVIQELWGKLFPPTADGGVTTGPQVRMVGEEGPEAIIPLDQMGSMGGTNITVNGIFEESRLRDIMRQVAEDIFQQHRQVSGSVF